MSNALEELRDVTVRALTAQRKRLARRCDAVRRDLARIDQAQELARRAALATAIVAKVPRGSKIVSVVDYASGEPVTYEIPLDPALPARQSLDRIFSRARRLRNGAVVATARMCEAEAMIAELDRLLSIVVSAEDEDAIAEARRAAKLPAPKRGVVIEKPKQERKPPFRTFRTQHGVVLVGRGAARNDELTFHVAKPYHLWLHVRGSPGAHVVVPLRREQSCSSELLVDAAHLAAHFSDARGERIVEVTYVPRKFVRKPRGAAPGAVTMEREKVLALRFDEARAEHLLSTESDQNE